jgi:AcrR family transcriptional regulator
VEQSSKNSKIEQKLALILEASKICFSKYGYEKTTLDDIGKLAKLNKASLYYYFKNKEDIFIQVVLLEANNFIENLKKQVFDIDEISDKIVLYLSERTKYYYDTLTLNQLSLMQVQEIQPKFDELYKRIETTEATFIQNILEEGISTHKLAKHETQMLSETLLIIANAIKHDTYLKSGGIVAQINIDYTEAQLKIKNIINLIFKGLSINSQ